MESKISASPGQAKKLYDGLNRRKTCMLFTEEGTGLGASSR